jgi:hypothetical protein
MSTGERYAIEKYKVEHPRLNARQIAVRMGLTHEAVVSVFGYATPDATGNNVPYAGEQQETVAS